MNIKPFAATALALLLAGWTAPALAGLKDYVEKPDDSYQYEVVESRTLGENTADIVRLTSQTWQGIPWEHWLVVITPKKVAHPESCLLLIAGGDNDDPMPSGGSGEARILNRVASQTESTVAILMQTPNQPLFNGRTEDQIIAYTQDKYLKREGEEWQSWPLLFPMVKGAVRAMDTVAAVASEQHGNDIKEFFVSGGSKRGWTTWLTAVVDDRVNRIAPMLIDVLNMKPQMAHQVKTYGGYSRQIDEYTELNLQERMQTPEGDALRAMVDPYEYRDELDLPKLVVLGANDPYWTVDAANLYYPDLPEPKWLYYQANTGHDVSVGGIGAITQFYDAMLEEKEYPQLEWEQDALDSMTVTWNKKGGKAKLWEATSTNRDFRESRWTSTPVPGDGEAVVEVDTPETGWKAYYVEVQWPSEAGLPYGACTKITVLPDSFPKEGRTYEAKSAPATETNIN